MALYLRPQDIIEMFVLNSGRLTNLQLVRHFGAQLRGEEQTVLANKDILKRVTHQVATRRRQGSRDSFSLTEGDGGKLLVLKNRFRDKTVDDIWSSLILTLPKEEIDKMLPPRLAEDATEETELTDKKEEDNETAIAQAESPPIPAVSKLTLAVSDKTKSVRDLTKNFDELASSSTVSLTDHLTEKNKRETSKAPRRSPQQSSETDRYLPLTREGRSWLQASMRGDFQTLARLARDRPELVNTREPSSGYTGLHWAAKQGSLEVVKLLAGTYQVDPDVRTRGGYTPLMLAALAKKHEIYDLLVNAYKADEAIRDFSGRTSGQYLELHYPTIPGLTSRTELSHQDVLPDSGEDEVDSRKRRHVARAATHQFISEFRESIRDIRGSFRENWLRPKTAADY